MTSTNTIDSHSLPPDSHLSAPTTPTPTTLGVGVVEVGERKNHNATRKAAMNQGQASRPPGPLGLGDLLAAGWAS